MTRTTLPSTTLRPPAARSVALAAGTAAVAIVLAACGGSGESGAAPGAAGPAPDPTTEAAPAPEPASEQAASPTDGAAGTDTGGGSGALSADDAGQVALEAAPDGSVLEGDVYEETISGQPAWEIDVNHPDGTDWDYYVHQETGEVLDVVRGG